MKNLLMSAAVGDIAGSAYEGRSHRTKDYDSVKMFSSRAHFTDDTVCTFACAEAFIDNLDMAQNLWKCSNEHRHAGFGHRYKQWMASHDPKPYGSFGNGSAMRCSSAGWLAKSEEGEHIETLFEPDPETILNQLIPMMIDNVAFADWMESTTAEQGSRRVAMKTATDNADELSQSLLLEYNKVRQANITQEITEIVGGSAAV